KIGLNSRIPRVKIGLNSRIPRDCFALLATTRILTRAVLWACGNKKPQLSRAEPSTAQQAKPAEFKT
ncbi:MAG: hypothetical protein MR927_06300, partial [Campylobacter sp.]|nr:hypothetical protein [Campylobacter sp.]